MNQFDMKITTEHNFRDTLLIFAIFFIFMVLKLVLYGFFFGSLGTWEMLLCNIMRFEGFENEVIMLIKLLIGEALLR